MALYNQFFYNKMMRKYVVAFGALFNNMFVNREGDGVEVQREKVPVSYAPKEKFLVRLAQDANLDEKPAIKLPRMSFEMTGFSYAPERKTNSLQKCFYDSKYHYNPVPYDINFTLYVMTKSHDDALQIAEQIMPFFTPYYSLTVNGPEEIKIDTPISLVSVSQEDTYDGSFEERRAIIWTYEFVLKGVVIGPVRDTALIHQVETNYINKNTGDTLQETDTRAINIVSTEEYELDVATRLFDGSTSTRNLLHISQEFAFSHDLILKDSNGNPVDLTGFTVAAEARDEPMGAEIYDFDVTVLDQTDPDNTGRVTLEMTIGTTNSMERGYGVFAVTLDDGNTIQTILAGSTRVYPPREEFEYNLVDEPNETIVLFNLTEGIESP